MRKKCFWTLFLLIATVYFCCCAYLFNLLSSDKIFGSTGTEGLEPERQNLLWEFVNPAPQCQCSPFGYESLIPSGGKTNLKQNRRHGNGTCTFKPSSYVADIEMSNVLRDMSLDYPSYVWTHTGWVQQMDTAYDIRRWDEHPLEVHVVPFSHHDPGWINTFETYYNSWTKTSLDLVVEKLTKNTNLTFVWAEVLFLERWYREANADTQTAFRELLKNGRFEIVSGGWVMTDEAVAHYAAIIDQLIEGQLWLLNEFGYQVRSAWSLDPFGLSSTVAHLYHLSGVKSMYVQRAHYAVKKHLAFKKQVEFNWHQEWDREPDSSVFCHLSPYLLYSIPYSCGPDINVCCQLDFTHKKCWQWGAYQTAQPITADSVQTKANELLDQLRKKAQFFRHDLLLLPFGDDFRFTNSDEWETQFKNLNILFSYMNSHPEMKVKVKFSTLGEYLEAARAKATSANEGKVPTLTGDFFTYSDRSDQYWSGYFSSRPILKSLTRIFQSRMRSAEILFSYAIAQDWRLQGGTSQRNLLMSIYDQLQSLRRDLALLHHHDSITGTSRISVVSDTLRSIKGSLEKTYKIVGQLVGTLLQYPNEPVTIDVLEEQLSAERMPQPKVLDFTTAERSVVVFFNPLVNEVIQVVRLIVSSPEIQVYDSSMNPVQCQVAPVLDPSTVFVDGKFEVYFEVRIEGLGLVSFEIKKTSSGVRTSCQRSKLIMINFHLSHSHSELFNISWHETSHLSISNHHLTVSLCKCTYLMQSIIQKRDMIPHQAEMKFAFYQTGNWINPYRDKSGAYIFLPDGPAKDMGCRNCRVVMIEGPVVSSASTWMNITSQTITLYNTDGVQGFGVHVTNRVDLHSHDNVEVILKLKTGVANSGYFYTDLNGFQMRRRETLSRLPIQGNFYPMTSAAFIQDGHSRLSVLAAESHAVASLETGTLEMILDRRLAQDDWRGLKEGVQDNVPAFSRFIVVVERWKNSFHLPASQPLTAYPSPMVQQLSISFDNPILPLSSLAVRPPVHILDKGHLPCNVHLVNLRSQLQKRDNIGPSLSMLVVLHHAGVECEMEEQISGDCVESDEIRISSLFRNFSIKSLDEMTLTGTNVVQHVNLDSSVTLHPMEIKTWKIDVK